MQISIAAEVDSNPLWTFSIIRLAHTLHGKELSKETYCSVGATVPGVAELTGNFRIIEDGA